MYRSCKSIIRFSNISVFSLNFGSFVLFKFTEVALDCAEDKALLGGGSGIGARFGCSYAVPGAGASIGICWSYIGGAGSGCSYTGGAGTSMGFGCSYTGGAGTGSLRVLGC